MSTPSRSIRRALLARLMGPVVLVMILGAASAYGLARYFSQNVLDQWLYDSAVSLANRVSWEGGRPTVDLSEGAREMLEWDVMDRIYYEVVFGRGERLVGNAMLPAPPVLPRLSQRAVYYNGLVRNVRVRLIAVAVRVPREELVIVKVAETQLKRKALASQVLWISVALALLLALVSALVIWYAIGRGMASMETAVRDVRKLHAAAPLSPIAADQNLPEEVLPLVEQINDLINDLASAHQLNQRFIADAAHQLRTPLTTLRVQLEVALRERDPERHTRAIDDAVRALTRIGYTLHQLLTLAKADRDDAGLVGRLVDLDLVAREEVERRIDDALAAGVDLGYAGAGKPVFIHGQEELLRETVANLLDNALLYGATGRHVTVGIIADSPELYVEDRGPGIPESERERVRERFYRLPGTQAEGCGLGLAIVEEIVRRHAGSLVLETGVDGTGVRVRCIFPAASSENAVKAV